MIRKARFSSLAFFILNDLYNMTNKIVILDNSVELYEHYIDDDKWEKTLAFPRGGVTYLVSNRTIKFYAFEDYLYRNCIISMQLPIRVVDEFEHIDGEYEDIDELVEVLDRIFPTNDIDAELAEYLRIKDAELIYQPIGDYALKSEIPDVSDFITDEDLVDALDDYYTKDEADEKFQEKGEYYTKSEADERFQPIGDYVDEDTFTAYTADTDIIIVDLGNKKADVSALTPYFDDAEYDTARKEIVFYNKGVEKDSIDARPFIKDGMVSDVKIVGDNLVITFNTDSGKEPISIPLSSIFNPSNYYTKNESDDRFQPKGDYVEENEYDAFTATTSADIENLKNDKLDVTAYTPTDLSNYYTKQEVYNKNETYNRNEIDDKIAEAGGFDPTKYYTKTVSDNRFAFKSDIPSLDGYATEDWVLSKKYATAASVQQYITNLQQQINSIVEAVSGCCPTVETIYRWLTLTGPNDYLCSGTTKYEKQVYQQSTDGGMTWTNVEPIEYRRGAVLETDSPDCGYVPDPQYRWKAAPASDYMCSGTSKYYKVYYEVSYDEGVTWEHVVPEQTKRGDLIEAQSTDCGYIPPKYRWYTSQREYICSGTTKYEKQYYQVSYDNGKTWENVSPLQTRTGSVIEYNSEDCGYVKVPKLTISNNSGQTSTIYCDGNTTITRQDVPFYDDKGKMICCISTAVVGDCVKTLYETFWGRNELTSVTLPNTLERIGRSAFAECTALESISIPSSVIYLGDGMGGGAFAGCTNLKSIVLPQVYFTNGASFSGCTSLTSVTFSTTNSYIHLEGSEFEGCTALEHITIPKLVQIGPRAFMGCTSMQSITFSNISSVPYMEPDASGEYHVFDNSNNCDILVPSSLVNSFKAADGWKVYKDRIKAINS